jgi:hypothetical protein
MERDEIQSVITTPKDRYWLSELLVPSLNGCLPIACLPIACLPAGRAGMVLLALTLFVSIFEPLY